MKNLSLIFFAILGINTLRSQTDTAKRMPVPDGIAAPSSISNKFSTDYPNANPSWEMDGSNYRAKYTDKTTKRGRVIVYDGNGNIIRNDNEMDRSAYPAGVSDYYKVNFPNEEPQVYVSEDNMGNRMYYIKRKSDMIWFDKNGKYMAGKAESAPRKKTATKKTATKKK